MGAVNMIVNPGTLGDVMDILKYTMIGFESNSSN